MLLLKNLNYDRKKSDAAKEKLSSKNWTALFRAYLQAIDMSPGGIFDKTFRRELNLILEELLKEFPDAQSIERLILQYACLLANWR